MPVSLGLFLSACFQERLQRRFYLHNIVLNSADLERLFCESDRRRTLDIVHSALVDHAPVGGFGYHLRSPGGWDHDRFKKIIIAESLGEWSEDANEDIVDQAAVLLERLINPQTEAEDVRIFAWRALGRLACRKGGSVQRLLSNSPAWSGSVSGLLGIILFLEQAMNGPGRDFVRRILSAEGRAVKYRIQKGFLHYVLRYRSVFAHCRDAIEIDARTKRDLEELRTKILTGSDFYEGLKEIGFLPRSKDARVWENTQHAEIVGRLKAFARDYVAVIGRQSYCL